MKNIRRIRYDCCWKCAPIKLPYRTQEADQLYLLLDGYSTTGVAVCSMFFYSFVLIASTTRVRLCWCFTEHRRVVRADWHCFNACTTYSFREYIGGNSIFAIFTCGIHINITFISSLCKWVTSCIVAMKREGLV